MKLQKTIITILVSSVIFYACSKSNMSSETGQPNNSIIEPSMSNGNFIFSQDFGNQIDAIDLNEVVASNQYIEVDMDNNLLIIRDSDVDIVYPPIRYTVKVIITGYNEQFSPGTYFLDLCTGTFYSVLGDNLGTAAGNWPGEPC